MDKVKGSLLVYFVKIIRKRKDEKILSYLTEEDRKIVSGVIFPTGWYPLDTYLRILNAFYVVLGERKPENAREWGKIYGGQVFEKIYRTSSGDKGNISSILNNFVSTSKMFFTHAHLELIFIKNESAQFRISQAIDDQAMVIFYHILCGALEIYLEMAGEKNPRVNFSEKALDGQKNVIFDIHWD